ncbi:MAG: MarC family protein [Rhodospirillales bacterium]|jgi:multiple antibiotic resistance protein|nr:MarC family protein [Rhodospirillales bacterium]MBT4041200.1 MarC family protein [Rhodospirillales bacterium]MBT4625123.1 MarC family protein [Rhodospirillales bacterium]MBT5353327.1 MarC family protein [Rhodospirillales bacterium]MBT5520158.1 MarC family protein [Rhodospirillales bacterium]
MYEVAISAFITMFVIIDPIGNVPIFMALTKGTEHRYQRAMAIKGTLVAFLVLAFFAWFGSDLLSLLGIGLPAFRIAGGIMLSFIAFEMVFERRNPRKSKTAEDLNSVISPDDISVCPLAIPLLAGPGAIASIMLLMSNYAGDTKSQMIIMGALACVLLACMIMYMLGAIIERGIGDTISAVITRLLGIILAALSVQFITDGLRATFLP